MGLRELMQPHKLAGFLKPLVDECGGEIPLLLKLSPDLSNSEWTTALDISYGTGINGWVIANTSTNREETPGFPIEGGVSGAPVAKRADELLKITVQHLGDRKNDRLIVSVGGVLSFEDVMHRLRMGANLVQVYSALIFHGPKFFHDVANRTHALESGSSTS
jgi:dihydroorotate dehydrogenase